jgi:hypothetical protein
LINQENIETVYCLKDDKFDIEEIAQYNLTIVLGNNSLLVSVFSISDSKVIALEFYNLTQKYPSYLPQIEDLFNNHIFLQAGYWNEINVVFNHSNFAFVDIKKFKESDLLDYLNRNNAIITPNDYCLKNEIQDLGVYELFVADKSIIHFFDILYPEKELRVTHHLSGFMQGVNLLKPNNESDKKAYLYLLVDESFISIVIIDANNEIQYSNMFFYTSLNDMVYYVLFTLDIFKLGLPDVEVTAWSSICNDEEHFKTLSKYIVHFNKGQRPSGIKYSFLLDEIDNHRFFETFSLYLN